jgi:hypothetical protein
MSDSEGSVDWLQTRRPYEDVWQELDQNASDLCDAADGLDDEDDDIFGFGDAEGAVDAKSVSDSSVDWLGIGPSGAAEGAIGPVEPLVGAVESAIVPVEPPVDTSNGITFANPRALGLSRPRKRKLDPGAQARREANVAKYGRGPRSAEKPTPEQIGAKTARMREKKASIRSKMKQKSLSIKHKTMRKTTYITYI